MNLAVALELSVLFVCIWGFVAILLTGQFAIPMVVLCTGAVIAGYYVRRRGWRPSALVGNLSAIVVFLVTISIFATTLNLLSATLHLFLFLQVTKYITRRELSENRWCYVISLFNVIGASVITTAVVFGPVLVVHVFLMLVSLRLYVIAREIERTKQLEPGNVAAGVSVFAWGRPSDTNPGVLPILQRVSRPRHMLISGVFLTLLTLGMSAGLFSMIPRLTTQSMFQGYGTQQEDSTVSAFSENVEFGSFTEIQLDERVALFVQPVGQKRPDHVRMRGVALEVFDGRSWRRGGGSYTYSGSYDYHPAFTTRVYEERYTSRVMQPPGISNFLFGDSFPLSLRLSRNVPFEVDPLAQSVALVEPPIKDFQYEVDSMHEDLLRRQDPATVETAMRPASHLLPRSPFSRHLVMPEQTPEDRSTSISAMLNFLDLAALAALDATATTAPPDPALAAGAITSAPDTAELSRHPNGLPEAAIAAQTPDDQFETDTLDTSANAEADSNSHRWQHAGRRGFRGRHRSMTGEQILQWYLRRCMELPESLAGGRVGELAQQWTQNQETTFSKALAIEARLRTEFGYSLTPRARGNYIESFLFDVKEGHCEYFATSMAVLLRNIGIPARVVNGFYSNEWNALSGNFTVRQKDAHSWVEVWLGKEYGWMTFDPTPPDGVGRRDNRSAFLLAMSRVSDAVRMRWYRYVIDYSASDQVQLLRSLLHARQNFLGFLRRSNIRGVTSDEAQTIEQDGLYSGVDWRPVAVAGVIILGLLGWQGMRWAARRRRSRLSPVRFYDDLLRLLARRGIPIADGETPREFAERVTRMKPEWSAFASLTHAYYAARYQTGSTTAQDKAAPHAKSDWKRGYQAELSDEQVEQYRALTRAIKRRDRKKED